MPEQIKQVAFAVYDNEGKILRHGVCMEPDLQLQVLGDYENESVIELRQPISDATHWIDGGAVAERPRMAISLNKSTMQADGEDELVMTGLPTPCTVLVQGMTLIVEDGSLEYSTTEAGEFIVEVRAFPYQDENFVIEAL